MSTSRILFIINPNSGGRQKNRNLEENIRGNIREKTPVFEYTQGKYHAAELTEQYLKEGIRHFVAVGGDGTVNEIASKLINTGALLSIIPLGSGNGLARHLGIPFGLDESLRIALSDSERTIDAGLINNIPFFCTAGTGFDAHCARLFNEGRHGRGLINYIRVILSNFMRYPTQNCTFDDTQEHYFSITFGNTDQFGNNAYITPGAMVDDGLLDCTVIHRHPRIYGPSLAWRLMNKSIAKSPYTFHSRNKAFNLKATDPFLIHFDGESRQLKENEIRVSIIEKALRVSAEHY